MKVTFKLFRSSVRSWDTLAREASTFASTLEDDRVINISHAVDKYNDGTIIVWYYV